MNKNCDDFGYQTFSNAPRKLEKWKRLIDWQQKDKGNENISDVLEQRESIMECLHLCAEHYATYNRYQRELGRYHVVH